MESLPVSGRSPPEPGASPDRARRSTRFILALVGINALCAVAAIYMARTHSNQISLLGLGSLDSDRDGLEDLGDEVDNDLKMNSMLSDRMNSDLKAHGGEHGQCHCDCRSKPQLATKAATMLTQVGENVFFGPCGGCPCMKASNVDGIVQTLDAKLKEVEKEEAILKKTAEAKIPVDITMRVGQKGVKGGKGPTGFRGPSGDVGAEGPQGPAGPQGPRGPRGVTGPKGPKGMDGPTGPPGLQGPTGKPGIPGAEGNEGIDGDRGPRGDEGTDGLQGPNGAPGAQGPRGDNAPPVGKAGPPGDWGPRGPDGIKGPEGPVGPTGFAGVAGPDGAKGFAGARGVRGNYGKGCDGIVPTDGTAPKTIDACGVCGGDESECANTRYMKTAHAVGDPHYLTYDGKSFDYQVEGEFILSRHMNDIELQNFQMPCPNWRVRCNVGAAVITKNWNIQFKSEWRMEQIMVNGVMWTKGKDYNHGELKQLDVTTKLQVWGNSFYVWFNDLKVGDGAKVYGTQNGWGAPLPNNLYMNLYFQAPGRWSSGLSMTGLFANFNNNYYDDWDAIAPSTLWWVKGTSSSAFAHPEYRLSWDNRIKQSAQQRKQTGAASANIRKQVGGATALTEKGKINALDWTHEDEERYLKEVDPLTAKMRKRLFEKMTKDGSILRQMGQKKPTQGLAAAELDIEKYPGERPDHLRIEQQMLFRKEWKHLNVVQRSQMLAGSVVSSNANGMSTACKRCIKGSETCTKEGITDENGIVWDDQAEDTKCVNACIPWIPEAESGAVCKCWIDCNKGTPTDTCTSNAITNYINSRTSALIPSKGLYVDRCKALNSVKSARWKGNTPGNRKLWDEKTASNFLISFWWKPDVSGGEDDSYKVKAVKQLLYKGPETPPSARPVDISVDATGTDPSLKVTVAGVEQSIAAGQTPNLGKQQFNFIAVTKKDETIAVWTNNDDNSKALKVHEFKLDGAKYETSENDIIQLVAPDTAADSVPNGWMGKLKYVGAHAWDPSGATTLWAAGMDVIVRGGPPSSCGQ